MIESAWLLEVINSFAVLDIEKSAALEVVPVLMRQMRDVISGALSSVASSTNEV